MGQDRIRWEDEYLVKLPVTFSSKGVEYVCDLHTVVCGNGKTIVYSHIIDDDRDYSKYFVEIWLREFNSVEEFSQREVEPDVVLRCEPMTQIADVIDDVLFYWTEEDVRSYCTEG